ncbi:YkvA family protein [Sporosarcina trichiuri]|uniref:YkvA family protein n=1 Tax=Sporosarcina trichiuri TaxID=3056445 RepID=UPI0032B0082F
MLITIRTTPDLCEAIHARVDKSIVKMMGEVKMMTEVQDDYSQHYSDSKFWHKLKKFGKKAGVKVAYAALLLFYTAKKPTTPKKAKASIFGALGYFILPLDIIPDFTPIAGYSDDLSVLLVALLTVAAYIDAESKQEAKDKLVNWFGESVLEDVSVMDKDLEKKRNEKKD